ncbi:MAG TPA: fibronectin/fibrinogen-binding protein [Clostridiales bacterium]|nr:fibronectin/fibrinogen-binding protein [Clostridiales bacterium]
MALDGAYLRHICKEVKENAIGSRVEKIYQPNKDEIVLALRSMQGAKKLLLSARADSPRMNFTAFAPENPKVPPMLCMLLRKRLCGARLVDVTQPQMERIAFLHFDATDDLGDHITLQLAVEIMGKYSNVIFIDDKGIIIDALKRVDMTMSSQRLVLPTLKYSMPPNQDKINILDNDAQGVIDTIEKLDKNMMLNKALLSCIQGVSPIVCRELEYLTGKGADVATDEMTPEHYMRLEFFLNRYIATIRDCTGIPYMAVNNSKPMDFTFTDITQYGDVAQLKRCDSFSQLLDDFYLERDSAHRMRAKSQDLHRLLVNTMDRLSRKINTQTAELDQCADREALRIKGDLLQANLYKIEKGAASVTVENFYDHNKPIKIPLNPALSSSRNAQRYYKDYRKAKTAEQVLQVQIEKAKNDLEYINAVADCLTRATTEQELNEIRQELMEEGYLKQPKGKAKKTAPLPPLEFTSPMGYKILVGRNNRQNDKLTLKQANNNDIWFHTKNIPGSHTIIVTNGTQPDEETILYAASLAACHSKAKNSSQVPVDYTQIRNVSKPQGAKPGMVIYVKYKTLYVTPSLPEKQ